ncbi:hypothetical protein SUDANB15_05979 [Streptomyces sp. enrichment culture]|uniref:GNAT family N-acetyltransferase n=1 Tax=Streptomyces sp. enrichment culture TaxID=1795815 RepID=UPI003F54B1B8
MTTEFPAPTVRPARAADHPRVLRALDAWCPGPPGAGAHPARSRLLFEDFLATCGTAEDADGALVGLLIGSLSQTDRRTAHLHHVAVAPRARRRGVATALCERFFSAARDGGRRLVRCEAAAGAGAAFRARLGFVPSPGTPHAVLDLGTNPPDGGTGPAGTPGTGPAGTPGTGPAGTPGTGPSLRLRILGPVFALEHRVGLREPGDGSWHALVRAPEGLTVIREADPATPEEERWTGLYDADAGHGLDVPGLLAAVITPLAGAAVPVFVASTYHADLVLVPRSLRQRAYAALRSEGHQILGPVP